MITKLSTFKGVTENGEPLVRLFRQGDSVKKIAGMLMPEIQEWLTTYKSDKDSLALLVNALGASEYWGQNCFPAGTPVQLSSGAHVPIEEVEVGDEVLSHSGKARKVDRIFRSRATGLRGIRPQGHARKLWSTTEHPYWVVGGDYALGLKKRMVYRRPKGTPIEEALSSYRDELSPEWLPAGDIRKGDLVFLKIDELVEEDDELSAPGMASVLGWYAAEGCIGRRRRRDRGGKWQHHTVVFTLGGDEAWAADQIEGTIRSWGLSPKREENYGGANCIRITVYSQKLARICKTHVGKLAKGKRLSPEVMRMPRRWQEDFLESYFNGDGSVRVEGKGEGSARASTASEELAIDVRMMLARLGKVSSIVPGKQHHSTFGAGNPIFEISVPASQLIDGRTPHTESYIHRGYLVCPVKEIEDDESWDGTVYNIAVQEDNSYLADRVAVHNCNGDYFSWEALTHDCRTSEHNHPVDDFIGKSIPPYGYWTFLNAHPFVHHRNKDPNRAFGSVVVACLNPRMKRVELVVLVNRQAAIKNGAADVVARIDDGDYPSTSMGCRVPYDVCIVCGHKSKTRRDYCDCVKKLGMGTMLPDGRVVGVDNLYPRFFDISFVFIGADKTSRMMAKLASGLWVPQSVAEGAELYGQAEEGLVKAACGRSGSCLECPTGCGWAEKTASISSSFLAEKQSVGTGMPKKHYRISGSSLDGKGSIDLERLSPKPPKKVTTDLEELRATAKRLNLGKNVATMLLTKRAEDKTAIHPSLIFGPAGAGIGAAAGALSAKEGNKPYGALGGGLLGGLTGAGLGLGVKALFPEVRESALLQEYVDKAKNMKPEEAKAFGEELLNRVTRYIDKTGGVKMGPPPDRNRKEYPYVGTIDFQGLKIYVENEAGSVRSGHWGETKMLYPYGEILGTKGTDKDRLDVYVGPNPKAKEAYIVHQNHHDKHPKAGQYDEDKAMLGFNSPEEAKEAYLKHYDSPLFFRSITTMPMDTFKKVIFKEKGEKVAELEKIAMDLKLEDLFMSGNTARRRQRMWKDEVTGEETHHVGSGLGTSFSNMQKTAGVREDILNASRRDIINKLATHKKWAEIVKEIGPDKAIGTVSPLLSEREPDFPEEVLEEMSGMSLPQALSTTSMLGMALKPREFQRLILSHIGRKDLADEFSSRGIVFGHSPMERAPCHPLGEEHLCHSLLPKLLPFLEDRSYLPPIVHRRVIRITIIPAQKVDEKREDSPLLSKVGAAYNWYRREMVKVAASAGDVAGKIPGLAAELKGMHIGDLFGKHLPNKQTVLAVAGAVPLALMYSAHLQSAEDAGDKLNAIERLIARHPWVSVMGAAAAVKRIMTVPQAQQAVKEVEEIGKRIIRGSA